MRNRFILFCALLFALFVISCEGTYSDIYYYEDVDMTEINIEAITE